MRKSLIIWVLLWGAALSFWANFRLSARRNIFKDEATYLLMAADLPLDRFYYLAPPQKRAWGIGLENPDEALGIYLARLFMPAGTYDLTLLRAVHVLVFILAAFLFARALARALSREAALLSALFFCSSSLNLFYNHVLTRFFLSPAVSCGVLLCLQRFSAAANSRKRLLWLLCGVGGTLALGLLTYSAFKPLAAAVCAALVLRAFFFSGRKTWAVVREIGVAALLAACLGLSTGFLLLLSRTPVALYLRRGSYALASPALWSKHAWLTLISPVFLTRNGAFIIDETHWSLAQPYIHWPLAGFYVLGLIAGLLGLFRKNRDASFVVAWSVVLAQCLLAAGGPSMKHTCALFPFYAFLTFTAVDAVLRTIKDGFHWEIRTQIFTAALSMPALKAGGRRLVSIAFGGWMALTVLLELIHLYGRPLFLSCPRDDPGAYITAEHYQNVHQLAVDTAATAARFAAERPDARVYVNTAWGAEILDWLTRPHANVSMIQSVADLESAAAANKGREQLLVINSAMDSAASDGFKAAASRLRVRFRLVKPKVPAYFAPAG